MVGRCDGASHGFKERWRSEEDEGVVLFVWWWLHRHDDGLQATVRLNDDSQIERRRLQEEVEDDGG